MSEIQNKKSLSSVNELNNMIKDLSTLIAIPSVWDESTDSTAPFGLECKRALDTALEMANQAGFVTVNKNSYGFVEYGTGDECVGALCHLDVVPEGTGWDSPPYELTIRDGFMYGRGVADDKGSYIAVLYALQRIQQNQIKLKRRARIIIGTNEERGSKCIHDYVANEEMPLCSFVPDAEFPVINSEKGIIQFELRIDTENGLKLSNDFVSIEGGNTINMCPESCRAVIKKDSPLYRHIFTHRSPSSIDRDRFEQNFDVQQNLVITAKGVSAHAMEPLKGLNAIIKLFEFLNAICKDYQKHTIWATLATMFDSKNLAHIGLDIVCPKSGELTLNLSKIRTLDNSILLTFDGRLPLIVDDKKLEELIKKALTKYNIDGITMYTKILYKPNLYIEPNNPLIQTLLKIYEKHTHHKGYCIQIGGGTYARELTNAVAFGMHFPNTTIDIHKPNERYATTDFAKLVDIYYDTFIELCNA